MTVRDRERLVLCYVPAIDLRRVSAGVCPHLAELLGGAPTFRFSSHASSDQLPTLLTGMPPEKHGVCGVRLKSSAKDCGPLEGAVDRLPDLLTSTMQCMLHAARGPIDLATMPPRRRRRFDFARRTVKYWRDFPQTFARYSKLPNIFSALGDGRSRLVRKHDLTRLDQLLDQIANDDYPLEVLDVHCLDYIQHWNMHNTAMVAAAWRTFDEFLGRLLDKCRGNGIRFALLSDHGTEPVREVVDLRQALLDLDLDGSQFDYFLENVHCTFWFHSEVARRRITESFGSRSDGVLLAAQDLARYGFGVPEGSYGDAFFFGHPGVTLFPNDFYQPVANALLAIADPQQRQRRRTPWHQADHAYLPVHECEIGFMSVADDGLEARQHEAAITDVAPSVLALLGEPVPEVMTGAPMFQRRALHRRPATLQHRAPPLSEVA